MKCEVSADGMVLKVIANSDDIEDLKNLQSEDPEGFGTDEKLHEFFERLTCNSEFRFVDNLEGDLTSAPTLALTKYDEKTDEESVYARWCYMDYQVKSPLDDLLEYGQAIFNGGLYSGNDEDLKYIIDTYGVETKYSVFNKILFLSESKSEKGLEKIFGNYLHIVLANIRDKGRFENKRYTVQICQYQVLKCTNDNDISVVSIHNDYYEAYKEMTRLNDSRVFNSPEFNMQYKLR